jgi:hypothetical protein
LVSIGLAFVIAQLASFWCIILEGSKAGIIIGFHLFVVIAPMHSNSYLFEGPYLFITIPSLLHLRLFFRSLSLLFNVICSHLCKF